MRVLVRLILISYSSVKKTLIRIMSGCNRFTHTAPILRDIQFSKLQDYI